MKLKPLGDRLVVRRSEAESETAGGIIIPDNAKVKSRHGEVLAVGPGRTLKNGDILPVSIRPGDVVYFRGIYGEEVNLDGEDLVILKEDQIEGIRSDP